MISLKCLLVAILSFQLSAKNVLSTANVIDDAHDALNLLDFKINSTIRFVTITVPNTWNASVNNDKEVILQDLTNDFANISAVLNDITAFAVNVTGALDCVNGVLKNKITTSLEDSNSTIDIYVEIFENLYSLANVEIERVNRQFKELEAVFTSNCIESNSNCKGVSNYVIQEVERLGKVLKIIEIDFIAETHVLGYKHFVTWKSTRALLLSEFNSRIKNATTCLASKIEDYVQDLSGSAIGSPKTTNDSIIDSFSDLVLLTETAYNSSLESMNSYLSGLVIQTNSEYLGTYANIRNALHRANQTITALQNITSEFDSPINCTVPNLLEAFNSSLTRVLDEYALLGPNAIAGFIVEGVHILNITVDEVTAISLQIKECNGDTDCSYLAEKIAKKSREIPLEMRGLGNSTSVLMHQTVISVRESGARILRDLLEEVEVGMMAWKSCARFSIY